MQKEFEKQEKLRTLDEEHRKQYEEELKRQQQKHNQHERIHHPGNKAQLEEGFVINKNILYKMLIFDNIKSDSGCFNHNSFQCGKNKITWMRPILIRKPSS